MFWKHRDREIKDNDQETNIYSQAKGSERKIWGFPCSPDIPARMKMLAGRLQVPLYALAEHAFQLSAGLILKMAEETEERDQLRQHILEYHVGKRMIEKISRMDEEMADILDKERHHWLEMEAAVRHVMVRYIRTGLSSREIAWAIDYGLRCWVAVARGQPVPKDPPPEE